MTANSVLPVQAGILSKDFDIGRSRLELGFYVKFSCWSVLPWCLCGLASSCPKEVHKVAVKARSMWRLHMLQGSDAFQACWLNVGEGSTP